MTDGYFIGLMSGTSLDGVDAALVQFSAGKSHCEATYYQAYPDTLKNSLLSLHNTASDELSTSLTVANQISDLYADAVLGLLNKANANHANIHAIGAHGQTIRHVPEHGYSCQLLNSARLAEKTKINVISDFRSRDIAAGGQGAPLVPAFHQAFFAHPHENRAVVNIGGIANVTYLAQSGKVSGFDTGPGNILLDHWTQLKLGQAYDHDGQWAKSGNVIESLLANMLAEPYLQAHPPKSTGRDLFNAQWLQQHILYPHCKPEDIARTLVEFTAKTLIDQTSRFCDQVDKLYLCGGGTHNAYLIERIQALSPVGVNTTDTLGINSDWVEAIAFAWLAKRFMDGAPGNIPAVTGAAGPRILGTMSLA